MTALVGESSPDVIATFIQQLIVEYHRYADGLRRSDVRESVAIPVTLEPLDENLEPAGASFSAVTRDISCGGMGLFVTEPTRLGWVRITLESPETGQMMHLLARIEHCTPCGAFYIVGCRFSEISEEAAPERGGNPAAENESL